MYIEKITKQNINEIQSIYNDFAQVAMKDFLFEVPPLNFNDFKANFHDGFIKAYLYTENEPKGFLLYSDNLTESIEISLIYAQNNDPKIISAILQKFLEDAKEIYKNKTISYPMLGIQNSFVQEIKKLGFSAMEQVVLEQTLPNKNISAEMQIPNPYSIASWNNRYFDNAIKIIHNEFSTQSDSKFDVRFKSIDGCKNILECIVQEYYGKFFPEETSVLLYQNQPVGFCFINMTNDSTANIPLLVIDKSHQGKNFGNILVKSSISKIQNKKVKTINTTSDSQNIGAVKSYTKAGFKEKYTYSHAYYSVI